MASMLTRPIEIAMFGKQEKYRREDVISAVDECMKKHVDSLLQFLEGFSGRLSQLESHFHKLERSVADLQHDKVHNQSEKDVQLMSLEKMGRSIGDLQCDMILDKNEKDVPLISLEKLERSICDLSNMIHDKFEKDAQLKSLEKLERTIGELQHNIIEEKSEKAMQFKSLEKMEMLMGDLRSDMIQDKNIRDMQFMSLKENLQEVGRSVQILRDKQELTETRKELAKLQLLQPSPKQFPQQTMLPQQPTELPHIRPGTLAYPQDQSTIHVPETYLGSLPRRIGAEYLDHYPLNISFSLSTTPQHRGSCVEGIPSGYGGPGSTVSLPPSQHTIHHPPSHQDSQTSGYITTPCPPQPRVQVNSRMYNHMNASSGDPTQNFQPGSSSLSHLPANQIQNSPPSGIRLNITGNNPYYEMI